MDQRCLKKRNSKDGCTFPPNTVVPTPKIPQNPILGTFNAKPIIELSVSHTLMELRS